MHSIVTIVKGTVLFIGELLTEQIFKFLIIKKTFVACYGDGC